MKEAKAGVEEKKKQGKEPEIEESENMLKHILVKG